MAAELNQTDPTASDPESDGPHVVRGTVAYAGGLGIAGARVVALHKRLRGELELGHAATDTAGGFAISYLPDAPAPQAAGNGADRAAGILPVAAVDLIVRVFDAAGTVQLAESSVIFNAGPDEQLELTVDGGPGKTWSEYEQLLAALQPHLGGVSIADLAERVDQPDVSLLAGKTSQPVDRMAMLVVAHKLARRTGLDPAVHYGLARKDLPTNLSALLTTEATARREALAAAVEDRIVPGALAAKLGEMDAAIRAAAVNYGAGQGRMGKVLGSVLDQATDREKFLSRYAAHVEAAAEAGTDGDIATFWAGLAVDARLGPKVPELQFAVQAGALAGGHAPLVNRLLAMRKTGELGSIRQLAKLTAADWAGIITGQPPADQVPAEITGPDQAARVARYAQTLERIVGDAAPTHVLAYRAMADQTRSAGVRAFWTNVATKGVGFRLSAVKVADFLAAHPELLQGVPDVAALTRELAATQRVFNLTTKYAETVALLDAGLTSAAAIARLNRTEFVARHGTAFGDPDRAALVHDRAAHIAASAMAAVAAYSPQFNNVELASVLTPNEVTVPTITTLFGSQDSCACEHCRSAAGPAAYHAEVLEFLSQRDAASGSSALQALAKRRPDLGDLELTCANTNNELPYLDLVNEILEEAVAPFVPFTIAVSFAGELDARTVSAGLRAAFAAQRQQLTADHFAVVIQGGVRWFVTDHSTNYTLVKETGGIKVVARTYQTGADAARLTASPEHVNTAAYEMLRAAVFPLSLPLDLWHAETTTFLSHLGVDRATLMTDLSGQSPWAALTRPEVVAERLGICAAEQSVLIGGAPVRLAGTANVGTPAGNITLDGVVTAPGQLVLIKDQTNPAQNGVYLTAPGAWVRRDMAGLVRIAEGTANAGTTWRLETTAATVHALRVMPWDYYGLAQNGNKVEIFAGNPTPQPATLDWLSALTWVPTLLDRLALGYDELIDVLSTEYANPGGAVRIASADQSDLTTCQLWKLKLTGATQPFFERLHLFVRLWRRLGWEPAELDAAIAVLQGSVADPVKRFSNALLAGCLHVDLLAIRLGLSRRQVLAFWSPIPTTGPDPLYQRLFQNPAVVAPVDPDFALVNGELAVTVTDPGNAKISRHTATLAAALGVTAAELATLAATLVPTDALSLATVSELYRHVLLARGLGLPVGELLAFLPMTGLPVFSPANTQYVLHVVELIDRVRTAGTSVPELDYLLNHRGGADWAPADAGVAAVLDGVRAALRTLRDETAPRPDPDGHLLRARLSDLGWPPELVDALQLALSPDVVYTAPVSALPSGLHIPEPLASRVRWSDRTLWIQGPLTVAERDALISAAPGAAEFVGAVKSIFSLARDAVAGKAVRWPAFHAALAALPVDLRFPPGVDQKIYYDPAAEELCFRGAMSGAERRLLLDLSTDAAYQQAVQSLFTAPGDHVPEPGNTLCSVEEVRTLFDKPTTVAARNALVLGKVLAFLRTETGTEIVAQHLAEPLATSTPVVRELLTSGLHAGTAPDRPAITDLLAEPFLASDPAVPVTAAAFPDQFATYRRLTKVIRLVAMLRLRPAQLRWLTLPGVPSRPVPWFAGAGPSSAWLQPDQLPIEPVAAAAPRFAGWLRLVDLARLRDGVPGGADTVDAVLDLARTPSGTAAILARLTADTGWRLEDLTALVAPGVLNLSGIAPFQDETGMARLLAAVSRVEPLGASVPQCVALAAPALTAADGRAAVQLAKARHAEAEWPAAARPLRDRLREKQRDALVAYLVTHPDQTKGQKWRDVTGLYDHFLIDPLTSAKVVTSRLKQATCSAQLFVQRCLLDLEPGVGVGLDGNGDDSGWDDWRWMKTYRVWEAARKVFFYPENYLEPELRADQSPAFRDAAAELQQDDLTSAKAEQVVAGYLRHLQDVGRLEPAGMYHDNSGITHVFGRRTGSTSPRYYYRRLVQGQYWTPWESVDLEISERQIVPVVWNGRLLLFWPLFAEKEHPRTLNVSGPQPMNRDVLQIQLAWSEYSDGGWQPKAITTRTVGSLTAEVLEDRNLHAFRVDADGDELKIWQERDHSSQDPQDGHLFGYDSHGWRFTPGGDVLDHVKKVYGPLLPKGTRVDGMDFREVGSQKLWLPMSGDGTGQGIALGKTPGGTSADKFRLTYTYQSGSLTGARAFFFADGQRTYFVRPEYVTAWVCDSVNPDRVEPAVVDFVRQTYYRLDADKPDAPATGRVIVSPGDGRALPLSEYLDDAHLDGTEQLVSGYTTVRRYRFSSYRHPAVPALVTAFGTGGAAAMLRLSMQTGSYETTPFAQRYNPSSLVLANYPGSAKNEYPVENVDFSHDGAYSLYNWELFFHLPLLIAGRLTANQRFEEAQRWLHAIFDPMAPSGGAAPQKYWRTKPLHDLSSAQIVAQRIEQILAMLNGNAPWDERSKVEQWRRNPFDPHAVAGLRPAAYMKNVVMRYLDNLIAWGDHLFRRDTIESVNEATQLYILAAQILGPRPTVIPPRATPQIRTYNTLEIDLTGLSNDLVDIEYLFGSSRPDAVVSNPNTPPIPLPQLLYFGLPANGKLLEYWDTVADRLFKIRHSLNLSGAERTLPLFDPPIDPALLVQAAASAADLGDALADAATPVPVYRFRTLAAKAVELAERVQQLGVELQAALEKRDAEDLAVLRAGHETALLKTIEEIRTQQRDAAGAQVNVLRAAREQAMARYVYHQQLRGVAQPHRPNQDEQIPEIDLPPGAAMVDADGAKMTRYEQTRLQDMGKAHDAEVSAQGVDIGASVLHLYPTLTFSSAPFTVGPSISFGGSNVAGAAGALSTYFRGKAGAETHGANRAAVMAELVRREADAVLQQNVAGKDLTHIDKQIAEALVREQIADKELTAHQQQVKQATGIERFLLDKYTGAELFNWMIGKVAQTYFAGYQLAHDVAKRAERAYRFELGLDSSNFIQYGHWDSLRKGLLAGTTLRHDIERMRVSHLDLNRREHEMTKHVSLAGLHPEALVALRERGGCYIELPEALFDLDQPGHYLRRLKSVAVTIPCTTGPYTSISAKLTLLANRIRVNTSTSPKYAWSGLEDQRFRYDSGGVQSIVTSTGHNDAGMFQPGLDDDRYLPFEGAGAISAWRIELPETFRQFDYEAISDVVLHLRYTARDGGAPLRDAAAAELAEAIRTMRLDDTTAGLFRMLTARTELGDAWPRFLHPVGAGPHALSVPLGPDRFPIQVRGEPLKITSVAVFVRLDDGLAYDPGDQLRLRLLGPGGTPVTDLGLTVAPAELGGLPAAAAGFQNPVALSTDQPWTVQVTRIPEALGQEVTVGGTTVRRLKEGVLADVGIVWGYTF